MNARASYFKIGVFVIAGVTIAIIAVTVLGAGVLFRKKILTEAYFEESVQGLDVGSPVKFRGVRIGKVEKITLVGKEYTTDRRYVLVRMSIYPEACPATTEELCKVGLKRQIENGLRVRLSFMGLTGSAYLEFDYLEPERYGPLEIDWTPKHFYVPSAPSTIARLGESLDRIMRNLEQINIQGIGEDLGRSLKAMAETLEGVNFERISLQADQLLVEVRETNRRIGRILERGNLETTLADASATAATARQILESSQKPLSRFLAALEETSTSISTMAEKVTKLSAQVPENLDQLKRTMQRLDALVTGQQQNLEVSLENIRLISENLRELTENARKYPSQLLLGEPPVRSEHGD